MALVMKVPALAALFALLAPFGAHGQVPVACLMYACQAVTAQTNCTGNCTWSPTEGCMPGPELGFLVMDAMSGDAWNRTCSPLTQATCQNVPQCEWKGSACAASESAAIVGLFGSSSYATYMAAMFTCPSKTQEACTGKCQLLGGSACMPATSLLSDTSAAAALKVAECQGQSAQQACSAVANCAWVTKSQGPTNTSSCEATKAVQMQAVGCPGAATVVAPTTSTTRASPHAHVSGASSVRAGAALLAAAAAALGQWP